jgi:hypothetical protein
LTDTQKGFGCIKEKKDAEILYWYFSWSAFTKEAGEYAKRNGIRVVSGGELV